VRLGNRAYPAPAPGIAAPIPQLPAQLLAALLRDAGSVPLSKGEVLFERGDPGDACFLVRRGVVKVSMISAQGTEAILAFYGASGLFGELSMIDGLPRAVTARAVSDCELAVISRAVFMSCLETFPGMAAPLAVFLAGRLRRSGEQAGSASLLPARARVALAVLQIARAAGTEAGAGRKTIGLGITRADIAALAGVSREAASRFMSAWTKSGIVAGGPGSVLVVDLAVLQAEVYDAPALA
jgi:CRP/FNR family transcriptional regulator